MRLHWRKFPGFSLLSVQSGAIVEGFATDAVLQIAGVGLVVLLVVWVCDLECWWGVKKVWF